MSFKVGAVSLRLFRNVAVLVNEKPFFSFTNVSFDISLFLHGGSHAPTPTHTSLDLLLTQLFYLSCKIKCRLDSSKNRNVEWSAEIVKFDLPVNLWRKMDRNKKAPFRFHEFIFLERCCYLFSFLFSAFFSDQQKSASGPWRGSESRRTHEISFRRWRWRWEAIKCRIRGKKQWFVF